MSIGLQIMCVFIGFGIMMYCIYKGLDDENLW